jgi:phosphate transport system protein
MFRHSQRSPDSPASAGGPQHGTRGVFDRQLQQLKKRLVTEATSAIAMLESALDALWKLDVEAAKEVRRRDDRIDEEEVAIEQECFRLLALEHPFARDFRRIAFILKVNGDIERVADHASGIAKATGKLDRSISLPWPTALQDMAQRVPMMCHQLLRAVLDEDPAIARQIVEEDDTIDNLEKRLFQEIDEMVRKDVALTSNGLLLYRIGRDLERVGDLMKNIAEDVIYLATGSIVRHEAKRALHQQQAKPS